MSKIEKALRIASRQRKIRGGDVIDAVSDDDMGLTSRGLLPVTFRIQARSKHDLAPEPLEKHRIIHEGFSEGALTKYKMLRTSILQEFSTHDWKTLGITSPLDGAGKTVTAINLAITLSSQSDLDVFLIDLDLRNPSIADYLGMPKDVRGLSAYLENEVDLSTILWDIGIESLVVLASRDRFSNSSECITSRGILELVKTLRSGSPKQIVIFDLPPVLTADDAVAFSPFVDAMLMVAAERETSREDLSQAMDMLGSANVIGTVLNKTRLR